MGKIRFIIMVLAVLIIGAILLPDTEVLAASLKKLKGKTDISRIDEQGNVVLSISSKKLEGAGYKYGDVVKVYIAGKTIKMPIVSESADVDGGKPALIVMENDPYIRLSINGGSFAEKYGIATKTVHDDGSFEWTYNDGVTGPLKVSIKLKKAGAYADEYNRRKTGKQEASSLIDEGVDTVTKVTYSRYSGKNADMFLSKGDKIAVISPSALPSREQADAVVDGLKQWGYEPVEGKHVCDAVRTEEDILEDLEWALRDPEIKAIFCVRGGYGASEIADKLSLELIRDSRKLIIGYSDITIYHSAWTSVGVPSVHSCMSATFQGLSEACVEAEEKLLMGEMPAYTCESSPYCRTGKAKGILIGGNLSTFTAVLGSVYDCTKSGEPYILFLEDVNENMQHIHRYLTVLKHLGILDKAAGIVFGEWTEMPVDLVDYDGLSRGGKFGSVAEMISRQFLDDTDIPVAFGFPAGHGDINYPMLMGEMAELEVESDEFTLNFGVGD